MSPFNLSPLALVASLCGLVALAFAGYFLTKRLRQALGGPRHMAAAWGIIAINLVGQAIILAIGWNERSLITLMPALIIGGGLIRLAAKLTPRPMQLLAVAAGALPPLALTAIHAVRAYEAANRDNMMIAAVVFAFMLLSVTAGLWAIIRPAEDKPGALA